MQQYGYTWAEIEEIAQKFEDIRDFVEASKTHIHTAKFFKDEPETSERYMGYCKKALDGAERIANMMAADVRTVLEEKRKDDDPLEIKDYDVLELKQLVVPCGWVRAMLALPTELRKMSFKAFYKEALEWKAQEGDRTTTVLVAFVKAREVKE